MDSVIESMKAKGFTFLGIVEGEKIFCNLDSWVSIMNCLEFLEKITGEEWTTFKEETGNKNLVFYRTSMYTVVDKYYLKFKVGNNIELPLNCSSCFCLFKECVLPESFSLGNNFDTSKIVNMAGMFEDCALPEGFSLGDKFDTSSVNNMASMFEDCLLPKGFTLGDKFDTFSVDNMGYMFECCKLPKGFSLGHKFDTSNVEDMSYMFHECTLPEGFSLGDNFNVSSVKSIHHMFYHCKLPEGKTEVDFGSTKSIIEWLKSRCTGRLSAF